jgi:hypothetical protein
MQEWLQHQQLHGEHVPPGCLEGNLPVVLEITAPEQ